MITYISDGLLKLLGYTRTEFYEKFHDKFTEMVYREDLSRVLSEIDEQTKNSLHDHCEYRIEMKNGDLKWVFDVGRVVKGADGKVWYYVIVFDLDARKELENKLKDESQRTAALIKNTPGGVMTLVYTDGKFKCEYASEGVSRLLGYSHEELLHNLYDDVYFCIHPDDNLIKEKMLACVGGGRFDFDYRVIRKDGTCIWINLTGNPVTDKNGVLHYYCSYTDTTEHKKYEQSLKALNENTEKALRKQMIENKRNLIIIEQNNIAIFDYICDEDTLYFSAKNDDGSVEKKSTVITMII